MPAEEVVVKGNQEGVVIELSSRNDFTSLKEQLKNRIKNLDHALMGADVALNIGDKLLTRNEIKELHEILEEKGLRLVKIIGRGRQLKMEEPLVKEEPIDCQVGGQTLLVARHLRCGQKIKYDGNVVVLGDVNPGAEIIASGHVLVMGSLRGIVHAGCRGEERAVVSALSLNPIQLRIAGHITHSPDNCGAVGRLKPEIARIKDNRVIIEELKC